MSTRMSFDLSHNHTRISSFSKLLAYTTTSGSHFSCTLGIGDTRNDNLALFLGCNLSRLLCMSTRMSSDLSHNHIRTSSFSNLLAYTTSSGSHFSCTLGIGDV
jgi:SET domain-containing protein